MADPRPAADQRIVEVVLEEPARIRLSPRVENERRVALFDLISDNVFFLKGGPPGPYVLRLTIEGERLVFDVRDENGQPLARFRLPLRALRKLIKDYFLVLDSYFKAIHNLSPTRIEAIDMGRRGLHNEGADLLIARLAAHVEMDKDTARRLFTLICVLHIRS